MLLVMAGSHTLIHVEYILIQSTLSCQLFMNFSYLSSKPTALKFILLLGLISLCSDMTYEGARSITGPYLASLGANAAIVGIVARLGELVGYSLRFVSGYIADRTRQYWPIMFIGYFCNLLTVPLLALTKHW